MYLVSTGRTTVLSDFADLETKSTYQHKNAEATDFQFYTNSELFVEVNKKAGLEVMCIKAVKENDVEIQRVRKLKIEKAYCVACARQSLNEIALGLSNGEVRIYNYATTEVVHKYAGDKLNSVISLDFNASDEYISAVQEEGRINIYGTKTGVKLETLSIDSNSILAKFHPNRRFQLAVASHKGAVTAYDISSKRKTFHLTESHSAPCRDICMSQTAPDTLISVGYDCITNIFDIRRKGPPVKLNHNHPLSTVALSDCGTFLCVGCLKGELTTYDMRNQKTHLSVKKVHDCAVNRVAFVSKVFTEKTAASPSIFCTPTGAKGEQQSTQDSLEGVSSDQNVTETRKSFPTLYNQRDSFCDFLDIPADKGNRKLSRQRSTSIQGRDSFNWDVLTNKNSTINRVNGLSLGAILSPKNDSGSNGHAICSFGDSFEKNPNNAEVQVEDTKNEVQSSAPLREQNCQQLSQQPGRKLLKIEEQRHLEISNDNDMNVSTESDKENPQIQFELHQQIKSTPVSQPSDQQFVQKKSTPSSEELKKLLDDLRSDMDDRLKQLEFNLKIDAERNKWQIYTQSFNLWQQQIDNTEEIRSALSVLLQTDPFVVEFSRLKEENRTLKAQLERLLIKKSNSMD